MIRNRLEMKLALKLLPSRINRPARPVLPDDAPALAQLMLDAYRGTIDDEGETGEEALAEFNAMLDGKYGPGWPTPPSSSSSKDGSTPPA
jgi:hypothetical protein